ncbi:uncharacterized protein si:dkey-1h24.6 [Girardinichthys multiradiatus]|uniref:uncharacterized protein si:dkey-1h24.6 n=1 Tax=Girardinichthys multiradiatus TaxID=208333 RepID=UPI001FAC72D2|nr:uncharacterized protein si:dkey-1h24.6 [Girardinichthys multiradiatus]
MMGVCWLVIILLCCTSYYRCYEQQGDLLCNTAESPDHVFVPCPNMTAEDVTFKLYRNNKVIYQLCTDTQKQNCNLTMAGVNPCKNEKNELTGFKLTRKTITKQVVYVCEGTIMYPPPVTSKDSKSVLVLEEEQGCQCKTEKCKRDDPEPPKTDRPVWIWIMVVALLSTYSLAVTIAALVIWYKMKDVDSQNDYMNTKPIALPKHRRKRGLQHPIPKNYW